MNAVAIDIDALSHTYPAARPRRGKRGHTQSPTQSQSPSQTPAQALSEVSFSVQQGEVFGVLGPNGSGKTTLFRILSTLMKPTTGSARIFGQDVATDAASVRSTLGVVFQNPSLDGKLTAEENLTHQGHLYGLRGEALRQRVAEMLDFFSLADRQAEPVEQFSGGMKRKVELAKAVLHRPKLLLLDEPATGLDPGARRDVWRLLAELRDQYTMTIALTTHLMDEADRCDRLAIMHQGQLAALDTPSKLKRHIGGDVITIEPTSPGSIPGSVPGSAPDSFNGNDGGHVDAGSERDSPAQNHRAEVLAREIASRFGPWEDGKPPAVVNGLIHLSKPQGAMLIPDLAQAYGDRIAHLSVGPPTLEDVFLHLTGHTLWGEREV